MNFVKFDKWEDDSWTSVDLQANYSVNNSQYAEPYMVIPATKGKFHVYIEASGLMSVKSVGGKADNSCRGFIAYDTTRRAWNIGNWKGCIFENYQSKTQFVLGHPDLVINNCKFDKARGMEADWYASFQLSCDDDDGAWVLYAPPIPKDSLYNYTVSYGEYTENMCEWGTVSISIDEDNQQGNNALKPQRGEMLWSTPERELPGSQRQDSKTPAVLAVPVTGQDQAPIPTKPFRFIEHTALQNAAYEAVEDLGLPIKPTIDQFGRTGGGYSIEVPEHVPPEQYIQYCNDQITARRFQDADDAEAMRLKTLDDYRSCGDSRVQNLSRENEIAEIDAVYARRVQSQETDKMDFDPIPDWSGYDFKRDRTPSPDRSSQKSSLKGKLRGVLKRPSDQASSTASSLTGSLRPRKLDPRLEQLTTIQRFTYENMLRVNKDQAARYLDREFGPLK